jgi:hypothetical protein
MPTVHSVRYREADTLAAAAATPRAARRRSAQALGVPPAPPLTECRRFLQRTAPPSNHKHSSNGDADGAASCGAQAQRPDAMDVWPAPHSAGDGPAGGSVASGANSGGLGLFLEPSSPTLQRAGGSGPSPRPGAGHFSAVHFTQQKSNQAVRKELQAHLATHQGLLGGYTDYLQARARGLNNIRVLTGLSRVSICISAPGRGAGGRVVMSPAVARGPAGGQVVGSPTATLGAPAERLAGAAPAVRQAPARLGIKQARPAGLVK